MATLTVGKDQQYRTIAAAIAATHDGDTVQIQAGTYLNDFATITHKITLQSVGGLAVLQATQAPPNGKAILTTETDVMVDGLGFTGAFCSDNNGAGIRYEGGNLVVRNSVFWNNQDGILGNTDPNGTVLIQSSEFSHNGAGDGYSHGIYINQVKSLTVQDSYFHDVLAGHEIKSRALATTITGSRIFDNTQGTGSYSIDAPDGGVVVIANNIIEKGANTANQFTIHYGGEHAVPAGSSLSVTGNTVVNDRSSGTLLLNQSGLTATLSGNALYGYAADRIATGPVTASGNTTVATRPTLNLASKAPIVLPPPAVPPPVDHSTGTTLRNWGTTGAVVPTGHILTVGPTGTFRTLESALAVARDGDTIRVAAGTYVNDFADINHKVIIEGVGGIARFIQTNDLSRQLGIFVANADATIRNVELTGAANYNGHEAGLYVTAGTVTLVNSKVDGNNVGVGAGDNAASNLAIYNSDIGDNFAIAKGTHNITVGAINSFTIQGSYLHGAVSGHELSDQAFNTDIENNRIIDGANVGASFLIDLGAGGAATIKNNLLVKGAQAANGLLIHVGGEAMTYSNSGVLVTGNTLVTQYSNPGHPYTYFVVGDPNKPIAPITVTGNTFVGGIAGSRWLTSATDGGNNRSGTTPTLDTSSPVSTAAAPSLFAPQSGPNTLKLVLAEQRGDLDAKFVVTVDGVGAGGGTVTAPVGSATQTFNFSGTWTPGAHQVAVTIINSQTGNGGGAYALFVKSVSLDNSTVQPNVGLNRATYTTTLTASAPAPAPAQTGEPATPAGFVAAYYLAHNPDVAAAQVDPLQHYLIRGWREGRDPSAFFDTNWYLAHNPDVKASSMNPLLHYDMYGWHEGRDPSALFSTAAYLAANPDVAAAGTNPLDDYLEHGRADGRPNFIAGSMATSDPLVDPAYLNGQLGDNLLPTSSAAAKGVHWVFSTAEWQKGLNPDAWFDTRYYLAHNPDVAAAHTDPLTHFETVGWKLGRDPSAAFSTSKYLAAYADVNAAGVDPLLHFVLFGQHEGRKAFAV